MRLRTDNEAAELLAAPLRALIRTTFASRFLRLRRSASTFAVRNLQTDFYGDGMRLLAAAMAYSLALGACARRHVDTSRPRLGGAAGSTVRTLDSLLPGDLETVDVIKHAGAAMAFDRLGLASRRALRDILETQRRLWSEHRPHAYLIRLVVINECISTGLGQRVDGELLRDRILVRDNSVVGREPAPLPARYEHYCPRAWRVDDLFADVADALADTSAYIMHIQYDAAYGFPRSYFVERGRNGGEEVIVESFAPVPNVR